MYLLSYVALTISVPIISPGLEKAIKGKYKPTPLMTDRKGWWVEAQTLNPSDGGSQRRTTCGHEECDVGVERETGPYSEASVPPLLSC